MLFKKFSFILFVILFVVHNSFFSQNNPKNNLQSDEPSNLYLHVEGGVKKEQPVPIEDQISKYNIEQVNNMINAFETKKQYILNDQRQDSLAKENGWYDRVNYELTLLYKRKELLKH